MNAKAVGVQNSSIVEKIGTIIDFAKKENIEIKSLTYIKKENVFLKYLTNFIKRIVDVFAGIIGLIILIPLTLVVFIANKIKKDKGPIFYIQERIGKDGKTFKMFKYRTMIVGADEKLEEYLENNEEARKEYNTYKKLKNDPRITKIGDFLRKTSLDEMPQLLNLLIGDMSLVGPRPYLPREKEDMGEYYNIIVKNKPGITGYWQIRGRSDVTFNDRLDMDIKYVKNNSLINDIKILFMTFLFVVKKEGAV